MAMLTLDSLRKEFGSGRIVAVDDLSLLVDDGEFLTVVGPSGCGKSTTLRMIAGLERPTTGTISIGGENVTDVHARDRDVAMVFQNYALYPHKTVMGNMEFGLRMSTDLSKEERREKVEWAADMMGITELLEDKPDELSGGQKQRVALGRAIVREPDVFLFDEPLSNLDAKLRTTMRTEIQRLQNELDVTAVYVTHDQEEAMTMGDRMAILDGGELQQVGPSNDVYDEPANRFVAGFVGSPAMNFMDAELIDDGRTLRFDSGETVSLPDGYVDSSESGAVTVGIRPENVGLVASGGLTTTVEVVAPVGSDNYLYLDLAESFIARVGADVKPTAGETVHVDFDSNAIHLFDRETGESLLDVAARDETVPQSA
ncbi:ABC transporter ATP-binding protein [Halolamina sp.]|uniref:ABC transporter ATP-binding protein n=1 Tax=Halolamina sp. TaxID=1940283 RepID=UPI003562D003